MKSKRLLLMLLMAFALPWAANAQRDDSCEISYVLTDSYGDGWNGGQMVVTDVTTSTPLATLTLSSGSSSNGTIEVISGHDIEFSYTTGSWAEENSWVIYDVLGAVIWEGSGSDGAQTHTYTAVCPSCFPPTLADATNLTSTGATLSWEGTNNSYTAAVREFELVAIVSADFETGDLSQADFTTTTSSYPWTAVANNHSGAYCAKSGNGSVNSSTSDMVLEVTLTTPAILSFSAQISSESGYDKGYFSIDGTTQSDLNAISGSGSWIDYSYTLAAGTHTLRWYYTKDSSTASGDDCFYVDDIVIEGKNFLSGWITYNNVTSPYPLSGLNTESSYEAKVIGHCDNEDAESNSITFTTLGACPVPTALNVPETTITGHEATLLWTADNDSYNIRLGKPTYLVNANFETGDLSQADFTTTTSSYPWTAVANNHSGAYCAKSGNGSVNSSTSDMVLEVTLTTPAILSFSAQISSESGYDKGYFSIDGTTQSDLNAISGSGSWIDYSYTLAAGTHTLRWYYTKDSSAASGDDCFYVDDIKIANGSTVLGTYTSNTTSYNFTHLAPETTYTAQVQGVCDGVTTDWSEAISFTTLIACPAPTNLVYDNVTKNSVELSWTETGGATEWEICVNGDEENLVGVMQNPYTLDRLDPQTDYTVKVRAVCGGEDGESAWSNTISFTTVVACLAPTNLVAGTPGTREVELSWTENGEATEWEICVNGDETNLIDADSNPFTLDGLIPDTDYTVKVRANCGGDDGQSQWSNTVSFTTAEACAKPTNLAVTTDGATATATWEGSASTYNIDINGTVYNNVTSPYTFNVELSTTYTVMVQSNCTSEPSNWTDAYSFTTPACIGGHTIEYVLNDSYGDGWTGSTISAILVYEGCGDLVETLTIPDGYSLSGTLELCSDYYEFVWQAGQYPGECSFTFTEGGTTLFTKPSNATDGMVLYTLGTQAVPKPTDLTAGTPENTSVELSWTENGSATAWEICVNDDEENLIAARSNPFTLDRLTPDTEYTVKVRATDGTNESCWSDAITFTTAEACAKPTNLAETNITTNSATLSWNGTSERYVLQYRPWQQVGEDHLSTGEFVTYTYDLSEFKGQGSIAIRHYDVTDVFYLNVDNVQLKDAAGTTIFFEDFESGSIPSTWTNYDVDGDGYTWDMAQTGSMNVIGNYGVYSASWLSGVGALHPDNWLIISNVELGGTFSFEARGQDPSFPAENFAVYVSMESDITEVAVNGTSYNAENLTPATPYAWQVKGDCGEYQSNWVSSLFKTKDDAYIFATDGNWNDLANWTDAEGNPISELPTVERKVRVNAEAIIPAGVVATSGKTTITDDGSITIKDGGELKHNTATLWVTMEKDITAWTIGETIDENNKSNGWYFISTPFSGTTEIEASGAWSHVNNLAADNYDLYGFDPTAADEWINYKAEPEHAVFTAGNNHGLVFKRGYLYASDTDRTVTFTGTISKSVNYSMTETFDYDGTSTDRFNGWALVGNPFSCSAYINYVDGEDVLEADFYVMNAAGDGYELSQSSVALAPLTGAFINYSATGTVQFSTENNRAAQSGLLNMTVSQGRGNVDMARVRFGRGHNLKHMSFRNNSSKLYIPQDNDYAVVYTEDNVGEMPVSFKAEKNGTYSLSFTSQEVSFSYLHLIDNMTGNDVNLLETPSYTFNASTTDYANRFRLVFATGSTVDGENFGFVNAAGNLCIFGIEGEATVQVVDMLGHVLSSEQFSGSYEKSLNAAPGVYMLRLIQGNDVKVQKIVVR